MALHFVSIKDFTILLIFIAHCIQKNCFYHFQGLFVIIKEFFSKFKDNSRTNCTFLESQEFSRTKVIFKDFSRSVRTLPDLRVRCPTDCATRPSTCFDIMDGHVMVFSGYSSVCPSLTFYCA